ncbi:hypothetical protein [uncultured Gilliamella sp.]|uniref:hypothetical protein n=1 Tax=uncultured Gilliamella sp. TaxID=1193505 RepID=UPI0025FD1727|nr:hypothetical protein [uncultured Gilliamella sp.]
MHKIVYRSDCKPSVSQAISLYSNCSLGARRPITDTKRFQAHPSAWTLNELLQ